MPIRQSALSFILLGILLFGAASPLRGQAAMTSTNYTIYADSVGVNSGGGEGSGGSFNLQDTLGESPVDATTSTSYQVLGGYQSMDAGSISLSLSNSSLNLGTLSAASVSTAGSTATVTTNSTTGYTLSVSALSGSMPANVADGSVTAGVEEYGLAVGGSDAAFGNDRAVVNGLALASSGSPVYQSQTTLTFKASRGSASAAGGFSQSITITASANF